jgi:hypothetical protein
MTQPIHRGLAAVGCARRRLFFPRGGRGEELRVWGGDGSHAAPFRERHYEPELTEG